MIRVANDFLQIGALANPSTLPLHASNGVIFRTTFVGHLFNRYKAILTASDKNYFGIPFSKSMDLVISITV